MNLNHLMMEIKQRKLPAKHAKETLNNKHSLFAKIRVIRDQKNS